MAAGFQINTVAAGNEAIKKSNELRQPKGTKKKNVYFFSCVHNTLVESSRLSLAVFSHVSLSGIITVPVDSLTVRSRINCELA